jgi:hypothetical protein
MPDAAGSAGASYRHGQRRQQPAARRVRGAMMAVEVARDVVTGRPVPGSMREV